MEIIEITDIHDPQLSVFASLTEAQLRNRKNPAEALYIVESPKVIRTALSQGLRPTAILCEQRHINGDAADILAACPEATVFTGTRETLASLTGYTLTRGVLAAMPRTPEKRLEDVLEGAKRVVVIDGVVDSTNIGGIFRSAAALGIDAVLLTPTSCDPLNRRSIRVSMGSVFLVPWTWLDTPISSLKEYGFKTAAMALRKDSVNLDDESLNSEPRLAIVMGTEGDGLANHVIDDADYTVCIPMAYGVDSLNVNAAAAVAFWQLRAK